MSILSSKFLWVKALTIATSISVFIPLPGRAADRISAHYPPFPDFSISVRDLQEFATDGKIPADYAVLAQQASPAQLQQFRQLLQQRFPVSAVVMSQFINAPLVEKLLERIGESIQTDSRQNGLKSIRSALIAATEDKKQGLTVINFLQRFPSREINLDLAEVFTIYDRLTELFKRRDKTIGTLDRLANTEAATSNTDFSQQLDLRQVGTFRSQKWQFAWLDKSRRRMVPGDLYVPQTSSPNPVPVIVISHGVGEDRTTYAYLAQHLASHGFGVAVVEHVGENADRLRKYLAGMAPPPMPTELLDRPRDVSFLLDEFQRRAKSDSNLQKLDLRQVGLIGHSLGGYTVLALAGGEINFERVKRDCNPNRSLNLSVLLQCTANELQPQPYALKDPRIKAVFAISPLASTIFGKKGLSPIRLPVFLMGGSDDIITPAVPEQIYPFTWLATPDKYLAILGKGTHFSTQSISKNDSIFPVSDGLIGPDPAQAHIYTKALSLAFFQTHLANRNEFQIYLNAAYGRSIEPAIVTDARNSGIENRRSLGLNLVGASAAESISQILQQDNSRAPKLIP
jgi:predicted dienelactone hydrolase